MPRKAMAAYEKQRAWAELFSLAVRESVLSEEELQEMGRRVGGRSHLSLYRAFFLWSFSEDLSSRKRYFEAGRVLLEYARDIPEAVAAFVQGNELAEAERVVRLSL